MDKSLVVKQFSQLKLNGENYETIIDALCDVNGKDRKVVSSLVDELLKDGVLVNTSKKRISLSSYVGLQKGLIQITKNGAGFLLVENGEDIYISRDRLNGANAGDEVWVKKDYVDGKFLSKGEVTKIIKHSLSKFVGTIDVLNSVAFVKPDRMNFGKDVIIPIEKINNAKTGDKVFVEITSRTQKEIVGTVVEVLGKENNVDTDVLCIVRNFDLREEFPGFVLDVAKTLPQEIDIKNYKNRVDLRNEMIFTIDGIDTRDIDDAITCIKNDDETYTLGVHIADVGEYVTQNSIIDREAFLRGTSVYFPNTVFPMLPRELSNGICSLNPNVDRLALSCVMKIDKNGEVIEHKIFESVIKSHYKMNYDDVNLILKGDKELIEKYSEVSSMLYTMAELTLILEKRRKKLGEIIFDLPELKIILNENKEIETFKAKPHDLAERLIESFMICANETIAKHFRLLKVPFMYRTHDKPDEQKLDAFKDFISGFNERFNVRSSNVTSGQIQDFLNSLKDKPYKEVANKVLLRSMSKAKYSPEPLGHFALALKDYTHFTSPIRRYCDLTIHRIIKKSLNNALTPGYLKQLTPFVAESAMRASITEVTAEKCEREVDDYFKARYMQSKIGETYIGTISGTIDGGIFVELENTVEGFIPASSLPGMCYSYDEIRHLLTNGHYTYQMGDKVEIIVESVDLFRRRIDFGLKETNEDKNHKFKTNDKKHKNKSNAKKQHTFDDYGYSKPNRKRNQKSIKRSNKS